MYSTFSPLPIDNKATLVDILLTLHWNGLCVVLCTTTQHFLCISLLMDVYLTTTPRRPLCKVCIHSIYLESYDDVYVNKQNYIIYMWRFLCCTVFSVSLLKNSYNLRDCHVTIPETKRNVWVKIAIHSYEIYFVQKSW